MKIATGTQEQPITPKSAWVDDTQNIRFTDWTRADRAKRQIIENIESHETPADLEKYMIGEELMIDALFLFDNEMSADIETAYRDHKAILRAGSASVAQSGSAPAIPATAQTTKEAKENKGNKMFNINTNTGGESGPFFNYKNRAGQGMADGSWYLRSKDGDDWHYEEMTGVFNNGIIADIYATHDGQLGGSLKLGFIKFNEGAAPDRHIWASPMQQEQRKSEAKTAQGGYEWQNLVNFRVAIGGGRSALFDVNGWSGYKGVMALIDQMNSGFAANVGKAPLVKYTGFRVEGSGTKRLHVPEFTIAQWVDLPDCLKADAPTIATAAPAAQPAQAPAATNSVPAEASF